jgi:hypothetical protein
VERLLEALSQGEVGRGLREGRIGQWSIEKKKLAVYRNAARKRKHKDSPRPVRNLGGLAEGAGTVHKLRDAVATLTAFATFSGTPTGQAPPVATRKARHGQGRAGHESATG